MLLALLSSYALWQNRDAILESIQEATAHPEHGEEQYSESQFGAIIATIETAATESSTRDKLQARLARDSNLTDPVLYVACKVAGSVEIELVKRFDWQGRRTITYGKYGSGTLNALRKEHTHFHLPPRQRLELYGHPYYLLQTSGNRSLEHFSRQLINSLSLV